jgi:hypothetical protein
MVNYQQNYKLQNIVTVELIIMLYDEQKRIRILYIGNTSNKIIDYIMILLLYVILLQLKRYY